MKSMRCTKVAGKKMESLPNATEICKIIVTCRRAGVSSLKLGPLEVEFGARSAPPLPDPALQVHIGAVPPPAAQVPEQTIQAQREIEKLSLEEQGIQTREEQVAELLVTDPLLAEDLMMMGELGESKDGTDQGEALD